MTKAVGEDGRRERLLRRWLLGLVAISVVLAAGLVMELASWAPPPSDTMSPPDAGVAAATAKPKLRVAVAPIMSPRSSLPRYAGIAALLGAQLGREGELLLRDSYAEVDALLKTRHADVAFVCTWAFVEGERDYGLELLAAPVMAGDTHYRALVLVPAGDDAERIEDLQGRRIAAADPLSNTGWLYLADQLVQRGLDPDTFFSEVVFTGGHDRSVAAVAEGDVDAASVDGVVYDELVAGDPALARRVKIIHTSPEFGTPPVVAPPGLDPAVRTRLVRALLTLHETEEGRAALARVGIARFVAPDPAAYDAVREMAARYHAREAR